MRRLHESIAVVGDHFPGGVPGLGLALTLLAILVSILWYWHPQWWHGLVRAVTALVRAVAGWRRRGRRRPRTEPAAAPEPAPAPLADDALPELPAAALTLSADELAAQGRYKEAVRERLRAILRDLVERRVIDHRPGWTVTELAGMAASARPELAAPLAAATELFSRIWYGQQDATGADDTAMREYAERVRTLLPASGAVGRGVA